jgi:hypothetical protein
MADDLTRRTNPPPGGLPARALEADTIPASSPPVVEPPPVPPRPSDDARYRLGVELGRGGMGRVVEAFDTQLGRTVAFKEVLPNTGESIARRFRREVQITAMLEHASIVPLYDSGTMRDGRPFYVMRRVTGRPLEELIRPNRSFAERLAQLPHLLAAIDAVGHAHGRGVIHRDLKPSNILVGELGETVVIDWGLAKRIGEREPLDDDSQAPGDSLRTQIGAVFGTPGFMSPEQARGEELGKEADVFALGVTLYQLLSGKRPIPGSSATEVISSTLAHAIEPVAKVCPQAPPELTAIVGKALAYERGQRYRDAGELAADVRRFLTGQLVEAHRYSGWQRVARFARRHKGALAAVTAVALAGAAATSYLFHQLVDQRDQATAAEQRAEAGRHDADRANAALAERNDQLTVWRAESLLDANPTGAAAALEQVRASSPRLEEARAVAQAAAVRGVASEIPISREPAVFDELDPEARRLVHVTIDGALDVYDLDLRRSVMSKKFARGARPLWVAGGAQLLVASYKTPAELVDPDSGAVQPAALPVMPFAEVSADGETVLFLDQANRVGLLHAHGDAYQMLGTEPVQQAELGPDGTWYATAAGGHVRVFDPTGKELAHHDGSPNLVIAAGPRRLAVLDVSRIFLMTLDPTPTWRELPIRLDTDEHLLSVRFAGDQLEVFSTRRLLAQWNGTAIDEGVAMTPRLPAAAGADAALALGNDDRLYIRDAAGTSSIVLPPLGDMPRLVARRGRSRFAVVSRGQLLVLDLADVVPQRIPVDAGDRAWFVDDDHVLLASDQFDKPWGWVDLRTRRITPEVGSSEGESSLLDLDPTTGRALKCVGMMMRPGLDLVVLREGVPDQVVAHLGIRGIDPSAFSMALLVPPDGVAYALDRRILLSTRGQPAVEIGRLDGEVVAMTLAGPHRLAAISAHGELVELSATGAQVAHTQITPQGGLRLAHDRDGRVLVANDRELLRWDGTSVEELGRADDAIEELRAVEGGIAVQLHDNAVELVAPGKPLRVLMPPEAQHTVVSSDGTLVAAWQRGDRIELVELPSLARWTLPIANRQFISRIDLAPSARLLLQPLGDQVAVWRLPRAGSDLGAWLSDLTNAEMSDHGLAWPGQNAGP